MSCSEFSCTQWESVTTGSEVASVLFYLLGQSVVCIILTMLAFLLFFVVISRYLDAVVPQEFGVRSSPFFFMEPILRFFKKRNADKRVKKFK
jgi:hypothetical protein